MVEVRNALFSKFEGILPAPILKETIQANSIKRLIRKIPRNKQWVLKNSFQKSGGLSPLDPILLNGIPLQAYDGLITKLNHNDNVLFVNKVRSMAEAWTIWVFILAIFKTLGLLFKIIKFFKNRDKRNKFLNLFLDKTLLIRRLNPLGFKKCGCCYKRNLILIAYDKDSKIYLCKNCRMYSRKNATSVEVIRFPKEEFANYHDIYVDKKIPEGFTFNVEGYLF